MMAATKEEVKEMKKEMKEMKKELKKERNRDFGKMFDQFLNRDMKSYEDNFRLVGVKYDIKDAQKDGDEFKDAFMNKILNIFVNAKILRAGDLFHQEGKDKGKLRAGVLRNLHPLSQRNNAAIVVALVQSWMTARIRQRLQGPAGTIDGIKIFPHYPPIIEALKNEAMKERRRLLNQDSENQKIVVSVQFKKPWVLLIRMTGQKREKTTLPFPVDDHRLIDPGQTLAELALADQEFVPLAFLSNDDKALIESGEYPAGPTPGRK